MSPVEVLPHDLDAEQAVLGCILVDPTAADRVRDMLAPADFYAERNGLIFNAASLLATRGEAVDLLTLKAELEREGVFARVGGLEYLAELSQKMPTAVSIRSYARIVVEFSGRRRLFNAASALARATSNGSWNATEAVTAIEQAAADARRRLLDTGAVVLPTWANRILDGAAWLRQGAVRVEPLWGDEQTVLAARLQPTILASSTGVGKTTIAERLVLGVIGVPGFDRLLGYPVPEMDGRVLYLACDRPEQARQSLLRMVTTLDAWASVEQRMVVWPGPTPEDVGSHPELILEMARMCDARLVIVDSLKDVANKLSTDEVGARVNQAFQLIVSDGRDVFVCHHTRKIGRQDRNTDVTIDDLYGSSWIYSGAGSVLYLDRGAMDVELIQLKTPNHREAKFRFTLHRDGSMAVATDDRDPVLVVVIQAGMQGISTGEVARKLLDRDPSDAERERVRKRLWHFRELGTVSVQGRGRASRWVLVP